MTPKEIEKAASLIVELKTVKDTKLPEEAIHLCFIPKDSERYSHYSNGMRNIIVNKLFSEHLDLAIRRSFDDLKKETVVLLEKQLQELGVLI